MSDTLESLSIKKEGAVELESVARTMKATVASNIGQFQMAVTALRDHYRTIAFGISACFKQKNQTISSAEKNTGKNKYVQAVVFGSEQYLNGRFNDTLLDFVKDTLQDLSAKIEVWAVGEHISLRLSDFGFKTTKLFAVPNSVYAITGLISRILLESEQSQEKGRLDELYIFYNSPVADAGYVPAFQRLLPLDAKWQNDISEPVRPTKNLPQVAGNKEVTLPLLIREYLFVSIYRACAESLASENASRLAAMQGAAKNIDELPDDLNQTHNRVRQNAVDQELFDIISGFEALKDASGDKKQS
jgi:F-type H+-transporting ATPase subunit gamma